MAPSVAVIANPISGIGGRPGRAEDLRALVSAMLSARGTEARVWLTDAPGHGHALAQQAAREGVETVIAWGGDGTVNEVAAALAFTETALAIVPVGSGNGLARHLGLPLRPAPALDVALGPYHTMIDVGELDGRRFVNVAGVGLDAAIAHRLAADGLSRRGLRRYVELTVSEVFSYRAEVFTVVANGETLHAEPLLLTLANGSQFGNGAKIAGSASTDDGRLDLVIAARRPPLVSLLEAPMLFLGGATRLPGVTVRQVSEVTITGRRPVRYHVDGEPGVGHATVRAIVHPVALRVKVSPS